MKRVLCVICGLTIERAWSTWKWRHQPFEIERSADHPATPPKRRAA